MNKKTEKIGVLLINLGTPDAPTSKAVRRYLKEFLNDPRVIDIPAFLRWILVNVFILPFRPKKSAAAYLQIWQKEGSPLLINTRALQQELSNRLGKNYQVELGMRYGNPSLQSALRRLKSCHKIIILPLFPQYSSAVTGSSIELCLREIANWQYIPALEVVQEFYSHPKFIAAYAQQIQNARAKTAVDLILFSYHGLPERQLLRRDNTLNDLRCYRTQCFETSKAIAKILNLTTDQFRVSFQSRLGKSPWIKPYTDQVLIELIPQGVKNLMIVCPSFVVDCLETLEEIGTRAEEQWQKLGGGEFILVPCLNSNSLFLDALESMIIKT